jgi:hypothetical protein
MIAGHGCRERDDGGDPGGAVGNAAAAEIADRRAEPADRRMNRFEKQLGEIKKLVQTIRQFKIGKLGGRCAMPQEIWQAALAA